LQLRIHVGLGPLGVLVQVFRMLDPLLEILNEGFRDFPVFLVLRMQQKATEMISSR